MDSKENTSTVECIVVSDLEEGEIIDEEDSIPNNNNNSCW